MRLTYVILGLAITVLGYLLVAIYFSLPPMGEWLYATIDEVVTQCAGSELEYSGSHACGFLDPRNIVLTPIAGSLLMMVGAVMVRNSVISRV